MGQATRYEDEQTTDAGGEIYSAICRCRQYGIPDSKIIEALVGELSGMIYLINVEATHQPQTD